MYEWDMDDWADWYKILRKDDEVKVFDWVKAAQLIKDRNPEKVEAGLYEYWILSGYIYDHGKIQDGGIACFASNWGTPVLHFGNEEEDFIECWKYQHEVPEWNDKTIWPEEALAILKGE